MNDEEISELRELFNKALTGKQYIVEGMEWLGHETGSWKVSEAELSVFQIDEQWVEKLVVVHWGYELLLDRVSETLFDERLNELIIKARSICPPMTAYGQTVELHNNHDHSFFFNWFAKLVFDIPFRDSYGFYYKRHFNEIRIIDFYDEM